MEIQWIMLAKEIRANPDTTMCLDGIFHRVNLSKGNDTYSFSLIAKVNIKPTEAFEKKRLIIYITRDDERIIGLEVPYKLPSLETWAEYVPYISIPIRDMVFEEGEYTFRIICDNQIKNQESIKVGYFGG